MTSTFTSSPKPLTSRDLDLELPVSFDYKCRYVTLENGIGALLIHDPTADKAGMGVAVGAGSWHNPDDIEGLAHFLEHMLFMGTEKYPEETGFIDFIESNGGNRNGHTDTTNTVYHFQIKYDKIEEAMDRLAQFFIAPLFTESGTDREIHAIDNEFNRAKELPAWKRHVIFWPLFTEENPEAKFSIGNLETLGKIPTKELRQRLFSFYREHYLPSALRVVAISKHSLDELETFFCTSFNAVPKAPEGVEPRGLKVEREAAAKKDQKWFKSGLEVHSFLDPTKKMCIFQWEIGRGKDYYRMNPGSYISHLIGHEGEGSIAYYLKKKGLIHSLSSGCFNNPRYSEILCLIEFTDEGWAKKEDVIVAVFEYVDMVKKAGPQKWIFDEISGSSKAEFLCSSKRGAGESAMIYSKKLLTYDVDDVFYGESVQREWDPEVMKRFIDRLTLDNFALVYSSLEYKETSTETIPYFNIPYSIHPMPDSFVQRLRSAVDTEGKFHLPEPNPYIPSVQSLTLNYPLTEKGPTTFRAPTAIYTTPQSIFYHKQDLTFGTPKIGFKLGVYPQVLTERTERDKAISIIINELVNDAFMSWAYQAETAQIVYDFSINSYGPLELKVRSYNEKFALFTKRLLSEIRAYKPNPERFEDIKNKCIIKMESSFINQTGTTIAKKVFSHCVRQDRYISSKILSALKTITIDDVSNWLENFWSSGAKIAGYIAGAINEADAKEFATDVEKMLNVPVASEIQRIAVSSIPVGCEKVLDVEVPNEKETNSCVYDVFEVGRAISYPEELTDVICANFLADIVSPAAFSTLRTEEQLGYLVWTISSTVDGMKYLKFIVMSASHTPRHVDSRIEAFIESFRKTLGDMPAEEFEEKKRGFISNLTEKYKSLEEEFSVMSSEFFEGKFLWQRKEITTKICLGLTKQDLLNMYDRALLNKDTRRKLSIQLHGRNHKDEKIPLCDIRDPKCEYDSFSKGWEKIKANPDPFFPDEKNIKY